MKAVLKAYIFQAIEVEKAPVKGSAAAAKKVAAAKASAVPAIPAEFQARLNKNAALKKAFYALTPGRQKAYLFHFSQAKQAATREARIDKYTKQILSGKGLLD